MDSSQKKAVDSRIIFLDYLRIFAFLSVMIGHKFHAQVAEFVNNPAIHASPRLVASMLMPLFNGGGAGVVAFFLVSGYIITHVLKSEGTVEFLVKRAFRIYPLYILAVLLQYMLLWQEGITPNLSLLIPQLLLIGDLFATPYALNGVEWTLRLEILFYLVMAAFKAAGLFDNRKAALPYVLMGTTLLCGFLAPLPSGDVWSKGYLTIYGPFLLLGSMFQLYKSRQVGALFLVVLAALVLGQYYHLIAIHQKTWLGEHFATLALVIFFVFYLAQDRLSSARWVTVMSDMTYAVYLFHNWLFDYFERMAAAIAGPSWATSGGLLFFFCTCYLVVRFIEKPFVRLGRKVLAGFNGARKKLSAEGAT